MKTLNSLKLAGVIREQDGRLRGRWADLSGADLSGANLSGADFTGARFTNALLTGARFTGARFTGARLTGADLYGTTGNGREVVSIKTNIWPVTYTAGRLQIGCQNHGIREWWEFSDVEIERMDPDALEWWGRWKPILQRAIAENPAVAGGDG